MMEPIDIKTLFLEYRDKCYGFFIKILNDRELAKDLTQDIFLTLIRKKEELSHVENWDNYIYTICRNQAYDHLKKAGHDKKYRDYLFRYWKEPANNLAKPIAEKKMDAEHYREVLEHCLEKLPDQQRVIFNLSKKDGLSHQMIADKLGISPITVRNHLHRALKNIRTGSHPDIELMVLIGMLGLMGLGW